MLEENLFLKLVSLHVMERAIRGSLRLVSCFELQHACLRCGIKGKVALKGSFYAIAIQKTETGYSIVAGSILYFRH